MLIYIDIKTQYSGFKVRFGGFHGSEMVMGEWIVGVISFQKMYGLYGLKHHIVAISGDVTDPDEQTNKQTTKQI